ncbi:capsule assembly Wzi family protein [Alteromonas facilis]|uniref:capsule assembly Wzi family protein n=1 Tax=Alteromonas facilis TaxID=2048004 RepID=UPI000C282490|nr:capsule assembly Wzi family protein [Alteromonas facilis]
MRLVVFAIIGTLFSFKSVASPWVGTLDPHLHHDLVTVSEYGLIDSVVNTYPVPWKGISSQLNRIDTESLPSHVALAVVRLRHYLVAQQRSAWDSYSELYAASDKARFTGFDAEQRPSARFTQTVEYTQGRWSAQVSMNAEPGGEYNLDQSYLAVQLADWTFAVSALDQWWGPGQAASLILTDNARPVPVLSLSRGTTQQSESVWLRWLGPWYFTAQLGELQDERQVDGVKLWRTRFTFKPLNGLELGASWAAMWGGEGQTNGLSGFLDVITFQKECANGAASCDPELNTTVGNHIAGFDAKYTFRVLDTPVSVYAQRVGEDAVDGYKVTDNANLFGISTYLGSTYVYAETSDTNIACAGDGSTVTNCYYESGLYPGGYRHHQRAIGSTFDSDAKYTTIGARFSVRKLDNVQVSLSRIELNPDGQRPSPVLGDSIQEDLWYFSGAYQTAFSDWQVKVGLNIAYREFELQARDNETDVNGYLHIRYAFPD